MGFNVTKNNFLNLETNIFSIFVVFGNKLGPTKIPIFLYFLKILGTSSSHFDFG